MATVSRETRNELNRRAAALSALTKHPSWPEMEAEVARKIEKLRKTAATEALSDEPNMRRISEIRGTIAALNWFVGVPKNAEHTLERFLREQLGVEATDE